MPDQLIEIVEVFRIAGLAEFGGEIVLVPERGGGLGRQRRLVARGAADQIAADGNDRLAAFRPEHRHDVRRARAPVKAGDGGFLNLERIHERDDVEADGRLLGVAHGCAGKKGRRAIAAQIGHDHPVALRRQQRGDIDEAVDVVGPAMQQDDRRTVGRPGLGVADVQQAGVDLLQRRERGAGPGTWPAAPARWRPPGRGLTRHRRTGLRPGSWRRRRRTGGDAAAREGLCGSVPWVVSPRADKTGGGMPRVPEETNLHLSRWP